MNEHLQERFGSRPSRQTRYQQAEVSILPPKLNAKVRKYYEAQNVTGGEWLLRSEIPGSAEIMDREITSTNTNASNAVELHPNKPQGPFPSKEEYLQTHYELLREDALAPLREAVFAVRRLPLAHEDSHNGKIGLYEKASHSPLLLMSHMANFYRSTSAESQCLRVELRLALRSVCSVSANKLSGSSQNV